jgi:hypothetical protein
MRKVCTSVVLSLLLGACDLFAPKSQPSPAPSPSASASTTAHASGARSVEEETDDFRFEYAYPAEAGNVPELAALLDGRLDRLRVQLAEQSAQGREAARDNGFPFNKYSNGVTWAVVADTPRFLSLSADIAAYTGGAHGDYGFDSLVLDDAMGQKLCDMLNRERAARRGPEAAQKGADDTFNQCVPLSDTTLLLGSSNGRTFNRIGVKIGPYVAGPYAEGSWEFTVPVDQAMLATVAPEYRDAFTARN